MGWFLYDRNLHHERLIELLPIMKVLFQRTKQSTFIHITTLAFQHMLWF